MVLDRLRLIVLLIQEKWAHFLGRREELAIREFIERLNVDFPVSEEMSAASRYIENTVYDRIEDIQENPDRKLIAWTNMEYKLFKALEHDRYRDLIYKGFTSVDEFVKVANIVLNRRKSRAGKSPGTSSCCNI